MPGHTSSLTDDVEVTGLCDFFSRRFDADDDFSSVGFDGDIGDDDLADGQREDQ